MSKIQKKATTKKTVESVKFPEWLKTVLIATSSALIAVFTQQIFFSDNKDYEMRNEILKENYEYYVAVQNFADIGYITVMEFSSVIEYPKATVYIDAETQETISIDSSMAFYTVTNTFVLPTIAVDSLRQQKWQREKNFIIENKNKIDQSVYFAFLSVVKIIDENPWPMNHKKNVIEKSIWSKQAFIDKWTFVNADLWAEADRFISLE